MIKDLIIKYKDLLLYGIFGILTTVVNIVVYYVCAHILFLSTTISTILAWILAVLFAYLTNRKMVFHSQAVTLFEIIKEIAYFFLCRLATGLLDIGFMYLFVDILNINDIVIKALSNIIVIILNFIASKLVIFKKRGK